MSEEQIVIPKEQKEPVEIQKMLESSGKIRIQILGG